MSVKPISENEVVGVWLKREFEGSWSTAEPFLPKTVNYTKERIVEIVQKPNFNNMEENNLRLKLLMTTRWNLLLPLLGATWKRKMLSKTEFQQLKIIREKGWQILSDFTGNISSVAERVTENKSIWFLNDYVGGAVNGIFTILESRKFDTNFILLESDDSKFSTILEGNKSAVAMYIQCFIEKKNAYTPFEVFVGHLNTKSQWQW